MNQKTQLNRLKQNIKKRNYKAFIFILFFTMLIWLFVQMSKSYDDSISLSISLVNVPENIIIENLVHSLEVDIQQTGFKILSVSLFNSSMDIDFNQLDSLDNRFVFVTEKHKKEISKSLNLKSSDIQMSIDSLEYKHFRLATKTLKVKSNFKLDFAIGYDSTSTFLFEPQFVKVSGNDSILSTIEYIHTKLKNFKKVSDTLVGSIRIQTVDSLSINYFDTEIDYFLPVSKFTEGSFEIPIEVSQEGTNHDIVIFPKTVNVNFKTSLANFVRISESGFKVVAKYIPNEDFMILELVEQPKWVKNVSLDSFKIDYLIKE
jgi:YbbR domain-containing protein